MDDAGVPPRFKGLAVRDAWAPYDSYIGPADQQSCAHALQELRGVADTADLDRDWCWATQAGDALVAMQNLVTEAIDTGADQVDPTALAAQIRLFRSAVQIGITETASRGYNLTKRHDGLAGACATANTTTCVSPPAGEFRRTTTDPNATSA